MLCNPQYIFHNVTWAVTSWGTFVFEPGRNDGGVFALAPPDARAGDSRIFPAGYQSLVGASKTYLLGIDGGEACKTAADAVAGTTESARKYANGILCRRPVRRLNIWSRGLTDGCTMVQPDGTVKKSCVQDGCRIRQNPGVDPPLWTQLTSIAPSLKVQVYQDGVEVSGGAVEWWQIAQDGQTLKQGFPLAVALGDDLSYRIALADKCTVVPGTAEQEAAAATVCLAPADGACGAKLAGEGSCNYVPGDIPSDWVVEFSDTIMSHRFGVEAVALEMQGRECGIVTSQHDRRFLDGNQGGDPSSFGAAAAPPPPPRSVAANSGAGAATGLTFIADCDITCVGLKFSASIVEGQDVCSAAGCGSGAPFVGLSSFGCSGSSNSWGGDCCNVQTCAGAPPPPPPAGPAPPPGATDHALGAAATGSSGGHGADMAVDGKDGTRWESSSSDPQWLELDLGSVQSLCSAQILWETAYSRNFVIQTSATGGEFAEDWASILTVTDQELPHVRDQINYIFAADSSARYVRFYGTERATVWGHSFWRLSLYSVCPEGSVPPPPGCVPPGTGVHSPSSVCSAGDTGFDMCFLHYIPLVIIHAKYNQRGV
jgi:hypothetical protein